MLIPIEVDVPTEGRPWVNYGLVAMTVVFSILAMTDDTVFASFAGVDLHTGRPNESIVVSAFTSTLVHVNVIHLAANMIFLWVFGNAVNYRFGHLGYFCLYVYCAWMAGMTQFLFGGQAGVGASGAVNGIMGAFLVYYPRNDVRLFFYFSVRLRLVARLFQVAAAWVILYWMVLDLIYLALLSDFPAAPWAHAGGFLAGLAIALPCAAFRWLRPDEYDENILEVLHLQK